MTACIDKPTCRGIVTVFSAEIMSALLEFLLQKSEKNSDTHRQIIFREREICARRDRRGKLPEFCF